MREPVVPERPWRIVCRRTRMVQDAQGNVHEFQYWYENASLAGIADWAEDGLDVEALYREATSQHTGLPAGGKPAKPAGRRGPVKPNEDRDPEDRTCDWCSQHMAVWNALSSRWECCDCREACADRLIAETVRLFR